ncbi:MAG: hypothetical protein SO165_05820 [Lachnospiraceae bacterium]|nr:hypothetical protein [Lachnospiraceae bacterium]
MKNCLVTTLKRVVDNDSLIKLGELKFKISGQNMVKVATTAYPVTTDMSILDTYPDVVFTENNERTIGIDHLERYRTASAACEIAIKDRYKLSTFSADGNSPVECNIADFQFCPLKVFTAYSGIDGSTGKITGYTSKLLPSIQILDLYSKGIIYDGLPVMPTLKDYELKVNEAIDINEIVNKCANLERIFAFYADVKGNIETLPARVGITTLRLEQRGNTPHEVTGDIVYLASWRGLTTLNINGTKIFGSIADFLDAMYNDGNGRTSGSITIIVNNIVTNVSGASSTQTYNFSSSGWVMA